MGLKLETLNADLRARIERQISDENRSSCKIPDTKQRECAVALEADCKAEAQSTGCPHVRFVLCRVKLLDVDAKYASVKDLLDGIVIAQIICGDKEGEITLQVDQVKVKHYADEQTIIEIS